MRTNIDNARLIDNFVGERNRYGVVTKTITATYNVDARSVPYIVLSAASGQDVTLPPAEKGLRFWISSIGVAALTVKNQAAATISIVEAGETGLFICDGTTWRAIVGGNFNAPIQGVAAGYKIARGVDAVTGTLTKATGLALVVAVVASSQDDMDGTSLGAVSATVGNQAGAPAAGSVILKCWKATSSAVTTLIAATAPKNVNWIAIGT